MIWDGRSIHGGQPVLDRLAEFGPGWPRVERLPAYVPELTPVEGIWDYLKRVELRNTCCRSLQHLRDATIRLCEKPQVIQGCIRNVGYSV